MSCATKNLEFQSDLQFAGEDNIDCKEWMMTLEVDGSIRNKGDVCSVCSNHRNDPDSLLRNISAHRLVCAMSTILVSTSQISVVLSIEGLAHQSGKTKPIESKLIMPCPDSPVLVIELAKLPPAESHWQLQDDFWVDCFWSCYPRIIKSAMRLNLQLEMSIDPEKPPTLLITVFVMNLASRADRRAHMEALIPAVGFLPPIFPDVRAAADIDIEALVAQGRLSREAVLKITTRPDKGPHAVRAYVAHALSVLDTLRAAVDAELEWFLIAEDDLMPASSLEEVRILA